MASRVSEFDPITHSDSCSTPKVSEPVRPKEAAETQRRNSKRVGLAFQIHVSGTDPKGTEFRERTVTSDVSADGCQFALQRKVYPGDHLSLGLADNDFARHKKPQPYKVVWVERSHLGWTIGVIKLDGENIWPMSFPIKRKTAG